MSVIHDGVCHAASSQARPATATPKRAPRQLVTKSELEQCSSYLVGRWTQQKINLAIEELAGACTACLASGVLPVRS